VVGRVVVAAQDDDVVAGDGVGQRRDDLVAGRDCEVAAGLKAGQAE